MTKKLPTPRMQLRWAPSTHEGYQWECHYELVLALAEWDIRAEIYKGNRLLNKKRTELLVPMMSPSLRNTSSKYPPCTTSDGKERFCDTPFRDGAHIGFDAKQLGNPPMYCIAPDGEAFEIEKARIKPGLEMDDDGEKVEAPARADRPRG